MCFIAGGERKNMIRIKFNDARAQAAILKILFGHWKIIRLARSLGGDRIGNIVAIDDGSDGNDE